MVKKIKVSIDGKDYLVEVDNIDSNPVRRSEEHTSELQSLVNLVCRLLLEKKKKTYKYVITNTNCNSPPS